MVIRQRMAAEELTLRTPSAAAAAFKAALIYVAMPSVAGGSLLPVTGDAQNGFVVGTSAGIFLRSRVSLGTLSGIMR